jgi:hypothetical protein
LPSVRKKALGKEPFADEIFAKCSLPSVLCRVLHSAKPLPSVK